MRPDEQGFRDSRLSLRESGVVELLLAQTQVAEAVRLGPTVQIRVSADESQASLLPFAAVLEVNSGDAKSALQSVEALSAGLGAIVVHNALQYLVETRQFLGACFAKLAVGGIMAVTAPHQFLHERKLRLPSRRDPRHRRFFTPNTLMAEIEEAIDPCAYRVRFLADCDQGYDYRAAIAEAPEGGQDILVVIERIAMPHWRGELDRDEIWAHTPAQPVRLLEIDRKAPARIETIAPDRRGVRKIAVVKLDHRGDFLMATEAFRLLRESFPDAEMTLVCGSWNVAEAGKLGAFDKIIPFDFFPEDDSARQETPPRDLMIQRFAEEMRGESYDLAVDLRVFDDTREILRALKARNRAGFDRYDSFPWLSIRLNTPSGTEDDRAEGGYASAESFSTELCQHLGFEIRSDHPIVTEGRAIVWGPYKPLKAGHYRFECFIEPLAEDFDVPFDIAVNSGKQILRAGVLRVSRRGRPEIALCVDRSYDSFEFRLLARSGYELQPFRFFGLRHVRSSPVRAPHQTEAMALLSHLIGLRLRDAYERETL